MSIVRRYNKTCSIHRPTPSDGSWGSSGSEQVIPNIPCRIQVASGNERWEGKVRGEATHRVFLPVVEIRSSDWLEIDGVRYDVVPPINDAGGGIGHHLELSVKEYEA